jgi:WD40 repeat protein
MRVARIKYIQNSRYVVAHFRHFITNQSSIQTVKVCAFACHSHDYCRTANYYSIDSICSLYEESTHVGNIVSSLSTTVINIQLCSDGIKELTHICYGDPTRAPIPLQTAFDSMVLVHTLSLSPAMIIMTTELMYVPIAGTSSVRVYDIETMALINTFFQPCNIAYFDMTYNSNSNVQNTAVQCQMIPTLLFNGNLLPSSFAWFSAPCFSDKYLIGQMINNNKLRIWSYNTTYLYDIIGLNFNMISSRACLVLDDTIYLSSNSAIQYVNISRSSPHTVYTMSNNPDAITTDAVGPHFFVPCGLCNFAGVTVISRNGILLAQVNRSVGYAVAQPSKYVYRLVVANNSYLNIYEI